MALDYVAKTLHPIRVAVWGEEAMGFLGVPTILNSYMLVPSEADFDSAVKKLTDANFLLAPWSYGSIDPEVLAKRSEITQRVHRKAIPKYQMLDAQSARFHLPTSNFHPEKVVLLRSSYVEMRPPTDTLSLQQFTCHENLYYPDKLILLESFIKALLKDSMNIWRSLLGCWAISYVYCTLMVDDDALDFCEDAKVREWFNEAIKRGKGGLDRTTWTKRALRGPSTA